MISLSNGHYEDREQTTTRPRRVAVFSGAYNHIADGVTLTLNRLVAHLEKMGDQVLVFAPTTGDPAVPHKGTLVPVPSLPLFFRPEYRVSAGVIGEAKRRLDAFDADIFHIATPDYLGLSALRYAIRNGIPVVSSYHTHFSAYLEYYHLDFVEQLLWKYLRWFYGHCRNVYVPTESMRRVLEDYGIQSNMLLWPRGVDTTVFRPERRSLRWRRRLGFADDEVVISFISRLVWEKGLDVFWEALQLLTERGINYRALVVGDGPARDELEKRLPASSVFTGHLDGADLATAYASSDIFCFPSETETFGNVTLEAMASGLPTVCADAPGSSSLVIGGSTGYLCEGGHYRQFADALQKLASNRGLRFRMGDKAAERARTFDWPVVLGRMSEYYGRVLGSPARIPLRTTPSLPKSETALAY